MRRGAIAAWLGASVAVAAACSKDYGETPAPAGTEAGAGDAASVDATSSGEGSSDGGASDGDSAAPVTDGSAPACDPSAPFGAVTPLAIESPTLTFGAVRYGAQLAVGEGRPDAGFNIDMMTRDPDSGVYGSRVLLDLPYVADVSGWLFPTFTPDGLVLYMHGVVGFFNSSHIYQAVRSDPSSFAFTAPTEVTALESVTRPADPYVAGGSLWIASGDPSNGGQDIYVAPLNAGAVGLPTAVSSVSAFLANDTNPVLTADATVIYLASDRSDRLDGGASGFDVWRASRAVGGATFDAPVKVEELSSSDTDVPAWVSADDCTIYIERQTTVYVARRGK